MSNFELVHLNISTKNAIRVNFTFILEVRYTTIEVRKSVKFTTKKDRNIFPGSKKREKICNRALWHVLGII